MAYFINCSEPIRFIHATVLALSFVLWNLQDAFFVTNNVKRFYVQFTYMSKQFRQHIFVNNRKYLSVSKMCEPKMSHVHTVGPSILVTRVPKTCPTLHQHQQSNDSIAPKQTRFAPSPQTVPGIILARYTQVKHCYAHPLLLGGRLRQPLCEIQYRTNPTFECDTT